jgi:hypothetical protein
MKSSKLLLALAATAFVGSVSAQSAFEGFYGQVATGYENNTIQNTNLTAQDVGGKPFTSSGGGTATSGSAPLVVGLGYTFSVTPSYTVGLGIDYSALYQNTGNANYSFAANGGDSTAFNYKISNRYNIYVTPGYVIDKDKLAYLKVGYSNQGVQASEQNCGNGCAASTNTANVSGYVLGLGYKQIITGGIYGFAEANYYNYSKASLNGTYSNTDGTKGNYSLNPGVNAYNFLVGVGYKF